MVDTLDPAQDWGFDPLDIPTGPFKSAAEVWLAFRAGEIDDNDYGADPVLPLHGGWFIRNYVHLQLAHLQGDELLLWDIWGTMTDSLDGADLNLTDEIATLLVASDAGDESATDKLATNYTTTPGLNPGGQVRQLSPLGNPPIQIDLTSRQKVTGREAV